VFFAAVFAAAFLVVVFFAADVFFAAVLRATVFVALVFFAAEDRVARAGEAFTVLAFDPAAFFPPAVLRDDVELALVAFIHPPQSPTTRLTNGIGALSEVSRNLQRPRTTEHHAINARDGPVNVRHPARPGARFALPDFESFRTRLARLS